MDNFWWPSLVEAKDGNLRVRDSAIGSESMAIHPADRDRLLMQMANEVQFLTNRLSEFESDHGDMEADAYRDYAGHVHPSIARLRLMVKAVFDNDDSSIPASPLSP